MRQLDQLILLGKGRMVYVPAAPLSMEKAEGMEKAVSEWHDGDSPLLVFAEPLEVIDNSEGDDPPRMIVMPAPPEADQ
jgi:hypothetical protein